MSITVNWESIGPKQAELILRKVHPRQSGRNFLSTIDAYARQMAEGHWDTNVAQTVSIDNTGALIDGWHRLNAIIKSGATIRMLVVRGVDPDAFGNYDAHGKRTMAFRMGVPKDTASIMGVYRLIARYGLTPTPVTREEFEVCMDFAGAAVQRFDAATTGKRISKITAAPVRAAAILQTMACPTKTDAICQAYSALVVMNFHDAPRSMTALYRRLSDEQGTQLWRFALAWRAFCPTRFNNLKLQIKDLSSVICEVRDGPLKDLSGALATETAVEVARATARESSALRRAAKKTAKSKG